VIVLGVDPGVTIGWCVLACSPTGAQPGLVAAGSTRDPLEVPWRSYGVALVAVELPEGFYPSAARKGVGGAELASKAAGIIGAARVGARLLGRAEEAGLRVLEVAAPDWRRALGVRTGGRRAEDVGQQIKRAIKLHVRGWPDRSNEHARDAAGVALFAARAARVEAA